MSENSRTEKKYTYIAFISYKSEDAKYAKRLKRDLQSYRLPTRLRKQYRLASSHCSPVFLDKTNLTPGPLDEGLRSEVQESRFLIVICSRNAHDRSRHLDDELKFFLEGGGDRSHILPFIVDESDNAVEECFPKALQELCRTQDIVGANIHDDGWRTAVIKLIASMLGIKRVELEAEDRKRTVIKRVTAAALMTSMLVVSILCWNYFRPTLKYYMDYTEQYGLPVGIGEIKKKDTKSLNGYYVIMKSRGKVRELYYENSYGTLRDPEGEEHFIHAAKMQYEYAGDELDKTKLYDSQDNPIYVMNYKGLTVADLDSVPGEAGGAAQSVALGSQSILFSFEEDNTAKSNVMRYVFIYDEQGYTREIRYASNTWNAVGVDADGVSGVRFERDDLGRPVKMEFLTRETGLRYVSSGQMESRPCVKTDLPERKMSMMREAMGPRQVTME